MSNFNFKNLIKKYGKNPVYLKSEAAGHYDYNAGGVWVPGATTWVEFSGAVVPLSRDDLKYDDGGTYSADDRKLYSYQAIIKGQVVKWKDTLYTINQVKDYADFDSGLFIYVMERGAVWAKERF